jgi:undecaprenyl diphosphate synthase
VAPAHVAIIMDGNGRWAKARGLPRVMGHRAGVEALRQVVRDAPGLGIEWLTVYAFSSENWARPQGEVTDLMGLLKLFIRRDLAELHRNGVKIRIIGERSALSADIRALLDDAEKLTAGNGSLNLVIAFNYGAREEITRTMRNLAGEVAAGRLTPEAIDEALVTASLDTAGMPDPDLVIRTSGEMRLSNFLSWQCAYSELVFLPVLWPDFNKTHLQDAIACFAGRERRFGGRPAAREAAS